MTLTRCTNRHCFGVYRINCKICKDKKTVKTNPEYPKNICALDIETYKTDFSYRKNSRVAIVGLKVFKHLKAGKYISKGYSSYTEDQMNHLKKRIQDFDGLIIGFNIYKFDLEVLERYFSEPFIRKIKNKTVDLFFLIGYLNKGFFRGLGLDSLSKQNLGIGKTLNVKGGQIPKLWLSGKKRKVIKYNHRDCDLTFRLWHQFVKQGFLKITDIHPYNGKMKKILRLDKGSFGYLTQKKMIKKYYWVIQDGLNNYENFWDTNKNH